MGRTLKSQSQTHFELRGPRCNSSSNEYCSSVDFFEPGSDFDSVNVEDTRL